MSHSSWLTGSLCAQSWEGWGKGHRAGGPAARARCSPPAFLSSCVELPSQNAMGDHTGGSENNIEYRIQCLPVGYGPVLWHHIIVSIYECWYQDLEKREDLRHLTVCSVDPPGCTDVDDALHCRELENGTLEVHVIHLDCVHWTIYLCQCLRCVCYCRWASTLLMSATSSDLATL